MRWAHGLLLAATTAMVIVGVECGGEQAEVRVAAKDGDVVQVHYHGTLDDGTVFDSSREREPLGFTVGAGNVIAGFDGAVRGLAVGESVTVRLAPEDAYGESSDDMIIDVAKDQVPPDVAVGSMLQLSNGATARVIEVTEDTVKLDANPPLAGQALTFEIELVAIEN